MILCYSGASAPSAHEIAEYDSDIVVHRRGHGDINWGRANADTGLNPDTSNVTNKRVMRELFASHDVPMPRLMTVGEALEPTQFPIVGRPDRHTKGRGFWLCRNPQDVRRALRGTRRKRAATHFMEFVEAPREYRVHIFLGKSIRISEKLFGRTGATARGDYITGKPEHNIKHVRKAAKKAVEAVGLDFGAVDILADDTTCWVLEVNSAPSLGGSMPRLYAEKFRAWFEGEL